MRTARRIATLSAAVTGAATFVGVAPFSCDGDGWCHGFVAFDYGPLSAGAWQALGAAALVGGVTWLLVWLGASPRGTTPRGVRSATSLLLGAGAALSIVSHSILAVVGPVLAGSFLWLLWRRPERPRAETRDVSHSTHA